MPKHSDWPGFCRVPYGASRSPILVVTQCAYKPKLSAYGFFLPIPNLAGGHGLGRSSRALEASSIWLHLSMRIEVWRWFLAVLMFYGSWIWFRFACGVVCAICEADFVHYGRGTAKFYAGGASWCNDRSMQGACGHEVGSIVLWKVEVDD